MVVGKLFSFGVLLVSVFVGIKFYDICKVPPLPNLPDDQYWGPGKAPSTLDTSVRPFKIEFPEEMIADLKVRLQQTRYTAPLEGVAFQYGFSHSAMKPMVEFWLNKYDFSKREEFLNQFPQFKTNVQGLDIHFIHIKPNIGNQKIKVLPLLLLHGWPGSIREFYKIIPKLVELKKNSDFVFEVIVPSLPGFAFSQGASKPGMGAAQIGVIMKNLMQRLGHQKFYVQGGDWGSIICASMATIFQDNVLGFHSNFAMISTPLNFVKLFIGSLWPSMFVEERFQHKLFPISKRFKELLVESGYFHQQATKPDSVGMGLDNSPAGLAAWIVEKFAIATDISSKYLNDGGITAKFSYTELIDNLMLYWTNGAATTAARIYAESFSSAHLGLGLDRIPTKVPMASARFPNEISFSTEWQLKEKYLNLIQITDMPKGGHFAALEEPELLATDIRLAVLKFEAFHIENSK